MKYAWIAEQGLHYPLVTMCNVLDVSISGYRAWKRGGRPDRKRLTDAQMLALIRAIHAEIRGAYGSPRMAHELRARGFPAGREHVERLMRENGICAHHKRRYKVTTDSKHGLPAADNLLDRNFTPTVPNQVWTSDITYLWTDEGWLCLAIVLDLFTNLSENIVIAMIKYAHEMQENNRRPQAWASRIAGDAAAGNQSPP